MKNVLITGGTGFIGTRLALECLKINLRPTVFSKENNAFERSNLVFLKNTGIPVHVGCITDKQKVQNVCQGQDVVFHLAAAQHEAGMQDSYFRKVNIEGTKTLLEAAAGAGVERFIHASTIGVYEGNKNAPVAEDSPCHPDNIYSLTKLEAENAVREYQNILPSVIIRISETYGPGDRRMLKLFKAIRKKLFFMIGSGENIHQPIFVDDLVKGLLLAAEKNNAMGKTFVLCGTQQLTTREMVAAIADQLQVKLSKISLPLFPFITIAAVLEKTLTPFGIQPPLHKRRMDFFTKSYAFKNLKGLEALGFKPMTSFEEGVQKTAEWYLEEGLL